MIGDRLFGNDDEKQKARDRLLRRAALAEGRLQGLREAQAKQNPPKSAPAPRRKPAGRARWAKGAASIPQAAVPAPPPLTPMSSGPADSPSSQAPSGQKDA